ncbi:ABC transporter substrate-binding protein [Gordonia desulfuricans]|uniref:ABC transporter substrate-binding protein n=1 Tax=Gordonia desulfuricans TaxID=89051 RepID=A0A7K3LPR4_9ACTN|nr:ABC transporter substrate-binding protein [Gordonia desulfuricans]NDK90235.1 ABC transporter substrate-binding protein [Gordonia desulfuricans]
MRRSLAIIGSLTIAAAAVACSTDSDGDAASAAAVSIENCGQTVAVEQAPQRVVSLNQGSTEILLSLGLADRMVGTATWTDPVKPDLAQANESVPRLADNKPSLETVLATEPDFVTASFGGTLGPGGVGDRDQFERLGVGTYLSPTDCVGRAATSVNADGARSEPLTMDLIYQEIRELAQIFDVSDRGEELISSLQQRYSAAAITGTDDNTSLVYWFADTQTPYMAGCCGSSGVISDAVGAKNIYADTTDEWPQVSWESVADRNPTAIVLADLSRRSELLLDEPTNHLDIAHQLDVLALVADLPVTSYVALHDLNLAARYCDRLLVMRSGRVVSFGPPAEVLTTELIADVYGVQTRILTDDGELTVVYKRSLGAGTRPEAGASRQPATTSHTAT